LLQEILSRNFINIPKIFSVTEKHGSENDMAIPDSREKQREYY
jgi:hypothetical protein